MMESGRRRPSLETLEKISKALEIPFHLFTLLASEQKDLSGADPDAIHRLAVGLSELLLGGGENETRGSSSPSRKAEHPKRKPARRFTQNSKRNAG
jgi:transcriptional regulator with XRE-family HTH domain